MEFVRILSLLVSNFDGLFQCFAVRDLLGFFSFVVFVDFCLIYRDLIYILRSSCADLMSSLDNDAAINFNDFEDIHYRKTLFFNSDSLIAKISYLLMKDKEPPKIGAYKKFLQVANRS